MKSKVGVRSVVVLGVGNPAMQDDGVGVWVVRSLAQAYDLPPHVRLIEAGVVGLGLLSDLEGADDLLVIDAVDKAGPSGALYRLSPEDLPKGRGSYLSAHDMGVIDLLSWLELLGKRPQIRILGIQPFEAGKMCLELTPSLRKAVPLAVAAVVKELQALGVKAVKR
jgi:hydrogenase maturation protease